ncbi:MAG: hypothetical protein O9301_14925 [Leptospira sp.]|nr:hypothetical protein [Leptospira sp.]
MKAKHFIYLLLFFGISLQISDFSKFQRLSFEEKLVSLTNDTLRFRLGVEQTFADANSWGFVRQSATWARGNSNLIDGIIQGTKDAGFFRSEGASDQSFDVNLAGIGAVKLRLRLKQTTPFSVASSAYNGNKTFKNLIEFTKPSKPTPSIQLFFDDPDTLNGNNGALIYYKLSDFDNPQWKDVGNVITESYTAMDSVSYGTKFQTYTWRGGPENASWISDIGRVILTEVDEGRQLCFRSVIRIKFSKLIAIAPSQTTALQNLRTACGGADQIYYGLAYMQNFSSPFLTTAKASYSPLTGNIRFPETICGLSFSGARLSFGLFDVNGFVRDGVPESEIPPNYPSATIGGVGFMSVNEAFARTAIDAATTLGAGKPAAQVYEYSSKNFLDGLAGASGDVINFKSL